MLFEARILRGSEFTNFSYYLIFSILREIFSLFFTRISLIFGHRFLFLSFLSPSSSRFALVFVPL